MFVFQEPSLLSSLQDNGLTDVMLHALLIKDVSLMFQLVCSLELNPKCRYCRNGKANTLAFVTSKGHTWGCMPQITLYL